MQIRPFRQEDTNNVIALWQSSGLTRPWNDPEKDIRRKLKVQSDMFLVGEVDDEVVATAMAGFDGHRGWINYLAIHPDYRRRGLGRQIVEHAERQLLRAGCPKINLQIRHDNTDAISFYESIGFRQDAVISFGKRLIDDQGPLYKILPAEEWNLAKSAGVFRGSGIDLADGFIHLSAKDQVVETARLHFAGKQDLLLVAISAAALGDSLRWEPSRGGTLFPHVYGVIPTSAAVQVDALIIGEDGTHQFPDSFF